MMAVMSLGRLAAPIIAVSKAASAATELFVTIDAEVPDTSGLKEPDVSADTDIRINDASFTYPSRPDVQILNGLNVHFEAGKVTAIVGPSGSGKSTIVALLERWYDLSKRSSMTASDENEKTSTREIQHGDLKNASEKPSEVSIHDEEGSSAVGLNAGSITVGDTDLCNIDLKWWRSQIGLVQQEPFLFNDTIFNNVAYGLTGTRWQGVTKEEKKVMVVEACKEAYADEFISKLPLVSKVFHFVITCC